MLAWNSIFPCVPLWSHHLSGTWEMRGGKKRKAKASAILWSFFAWPPPFFFGEIVRLFLKLLELETIVSLQSLSKRLADIRIIFGLIWCLLILGMANVRIQGNQFFRAKTFYKLHHIFLERFGFWSRFLFELFNKCKKLHINCSFVVSDFLHSLSRQ